MNEIQLLFSNAATVGPLLAMLSMTVATSVAGTWFWWRARHTRELQQRLEEEQQTWQQQLDLKAQSLAQQTGELERSEISRIALEDSLEQTQNAYQQQSLEAARWQERGAQLTLQSKRTLEELQRLKVDSSQQQDLLNQELRHLQADLAQEKQARELEQAHASEKLALLEQNRQQLLKDFELLSQKIFTEKQKEFSEQSKQGLDALLTPFRQQLDGLRKKVEDVHLSDAKDRASLKSQMVELHKLNQQMTQEAHALTTALKGENKAQGNWGEMVLESVLERSGLRKGEEYEREQSLQSESGQRLRPDVIIKLPEGKHIVIDSKVSLNAYTDYVNAESELEQAAALKRHLESVRSHIKSLSDKAYQQLGALNSPDFVFLFMPIEPAFMLAFQTDESLFNQAFEKKIVVVTPTTLLATLRTVASIWAIERRNQSTEKLADQAGKLYDKLVVVVDRFEKVGTHLGTLSKSYDEAWNSLKSGRGNLVSQADGFRKLGVRVKKDLSKQLVEEAKAEDELHEAISTTGDRASIAADSESPALDSTSLNAS